MDEYKIRHEQRQIKQFFMAVLFIFLLVLGWFHPLLGYFIPLCILLAVVIGAECGRKWCDWYCPRGSFYDAFISSVSPKKELPPLFKKMSFRIGMFALIVLIMTVNLTLRWPHPSKIGMFFIIFLTITTTLGVALGVIFHHRSWCTLCPVGTLTNLTGKGKKPLKINSDLCTECELCARVCPLQIKPYKFKSKGVQIVQDGDCFKCGLCVAICPQKALTPR